MTRGTIFWLIVFLWVISLLVSWFGEGSYVRYAVYGGNVIQLILFILLGWKTYGPAIRGD